MLVCFVSTCQYQCMIYVSIPLHNVVITQLDNNNSMILSDLYQEDVLECKKTPDGTSYTGTLSVSSNGWTCQRWDMQVKQNCNGLISFCFCPLRRYPLS